MRISLLARLFAGVALVLAASIGLSAMLTRRATLVEVREFVQKPGGASAGDILQLVRDRATGIGFDRIGDVLEDVAAETERGLILIEPHSRNVIAASSADLRRARIAAASDDGTLSAEVATDASRSQIKVRGAAPLRLEDPRTASLGLLFLLPDREPSRSTLTVRVPLWIITTAATMALAVVVTFLLSRRVLEPVTALTQAAKRMEAGDLSVRVPHEARGGDEITELGRAFNEMASKLSENERLRRQMVSDVAHELRSPVTNLRCHLEALQDELLPLDRANLDVLHEETLFLQHLIIDLQDLSLAEAGRLDVDSKPVDVAQLVRRVVAPFIAAPGAPILVRVQSGPATVIGDEARIEQVLRNLLSNARTHTPVDGSITVAVTTAGGAVEIKVQDTGLGIAAQHLGHVFDRFYRADESRTRATGGAGLGLAIARQLVTAHHGDIRVDSPGPGQGTTFIVSLPAAAQAFP
jgi:signal transduction histidine kinase